jgi:RimJ/RimL family protein N-acetyltransferase
MHAPPARIVTPHVVLRRHTLDDVDAVVTAINESLDHLRPWMPWAQSPATGETTRAFLTGVVENFDAGRDFGYLMVDPTERTVVGGTGLHARGASNQLMIGYWVHVDWTRRGIAAATARALTTAAFELPEIDRVEIHCDVDNVASAAVARAAGYELVGIRPRPPEAPAETGREMVWATERAR